MWWAGSGLPWGGTPRGVASKPCPGEPLVSFGNGRSKSGRQDVESGKNPYRRIHAGFSLGSTVGSGRARGVVKGFLDNNESSMRTGAMGESR